MSARLTRWRPRVGLAPIAWFAIALYVAFLLFPIAQSIATSLTDRNPLKAESSFVGLDNYLRLFTDPRLASSLRVTLIVVVAVTVVANVIGLLFAMLLDRPTAGYRVMRTIIFIPQVLSGVIVAFIWRTILTQNGLLNSTLLGVGVIDRPVSWIGTPELATFSICIVVIWTTIAFATVVYTASLQSVPSELYEAARMDGAGPWTTFRRITIPLMSPVLLYNLVIVLIGTFQYFTQAYTITNGRGDPNNATLFINLVLFREGFVFNHMGYAAAIAWLLFVIVLVLTIVLFAFARKRVYYAGGER